MSVHSSLHSLVLAFLQFFNFSLPKKISRIYRIPFIGGLGGALYRSKELEMLAIFKIIFKHYPNHSAIDVGANFGQTLLKLVDAGFNVVFCFEPDPRCCSYLYSFLRSNSYFGSHNITIANCALSNSDPCILPLKTDPDRPLQSASLDMEVRDFSAYKLSIPSLCLSLDEWFSMYYSSSYSTIISSPIILKIDVEGFEYEVILGAQKMILENRPFIFFEALPAGPVGGVRYQYISNKAIMLLEFFDQIAYHCYIIQPDSSLKLVDDLFSHTSYRFMQFLAVPSERGLSFFSDSLVRVHS